MPNPLYFGCKSSCLDIYALRYRWFGAVWRYENGLQVVLAFWFGDSVEDLAGQAERDGWFSLIRSKDPEKIGAIYGHIREQQAETDWQQRSRLPMYKLFVTPWKQVAVGWYVIRSKKAYPFYLSAVQRKRHSIWVEHVCVCENQRDLGAFIEKVNDKHGINLKVLNIRQFDVSELNGHTVN